MMASPLVRDWCGRLPAAAGSANHPRRVVPVSAGVLTMIASCTRFSGVAAAGAPGMSAPGQAMTRQREKEGRYG